MDDSILAGVPREGDDFEKVLDSVDKELQEVKEETEAPAEVKPEKPAESQTEKGIEKAELPDQAHFLKQNEKWEEMRKTNEELRARLEALEKGDDAKERSEFVASLVGDNEDVEAKWAKEKESLKEEVKRELIQSELDAQKKANEEREYWTKWTDDRLSEVEKEFKVDFKTDESKKNELSKIMLDYSPTDEQGNLDYRKGMKILNELNKAKSVEETQKTQAKKNIADATVSKETTVKENKDFMTSHDLRKGWRSIVR